MSGSRRVNATLIASSLTTMSSSRIRAIGLMAAPCASARPRRSTGLMHKLRGGCRHADRFLISLPEDHGCRVNTVSVQVTHPTVTLRRGLAFILRTQAAAPVDSDWSSLIRRFPSGYSKDINIRHLPTLRSYQIKIVG
jgi:hypothetical protein